MSTNPTANAADQIEAKASKIKTTFHRSVNFVKTHKKSTIAVGALTGLVVANALVEKKAVITLAPVKIDVVDAPAVEVIDNPSN